jgi:adenylate kinase
MVGTDCSIYPLLKGMVEAAGDRPVILVNPDLVDKVSAAGQQSVRGRQERIDFAASFETVYQFQNIYVSGTSYFPILGAITKMKPLEPWVAHQRRDYADGDGELYVPVLAGETIPSGESILSTFER